MDDPAFHEVVRSFRWAKDAMDYGRSAPITTPHWHESAKFVVMYELALQKFTLHPDLRQKLVDTGDAHLEEGNSWGDRVWGTVNGVGENNLGRILMEVRRMFGLFDTITATNPAWNGDETLTRHGYRKMIGP